MRLAALVYDREEQKEASMKHIRRTRLQGRRTTDIYAHLEFETPDPPPSSPSPFPCVFGHESATQSVISVTIFKCFRYLFLKEFCTRQEGYPIFRFGGKGHNWG